MDTFERPLKVGKFDNFTFTFSPLYLEGEILKSVTATTESANITVDAVVHDGVKISATCTGVNVGNADIHFNWTTNSRSGCEASTIIIEAC